MSISVEVRWFRCTKCQHRLEGEILLNARVSVHLAQLRTLSCANCGAAWNRLALITDAEGTAP